MEVIMVLPRTWSSAFFFQAEDGIRDLTVTGVQTCALPISQRRRCPFLRQSTRLPRVIPARPNLRGLFQLSPPRDRKKQKVMLLRLFQFAPEIGRASCRERV